MSRSHPGALWSNTVNDPIKVRGDKETWGGNNMFCIDERRCWMKGQQFSSLWFEKAEVAWWNEQCTQGWLDVKYPWTPPQHERTTSQWFSQKQTGTAVLCLKDLALTFRFTDSWGTKTNANLFPLCLKDGKSFTLDDKYTHIICYQILCSDM